MQSVNERVQISVSESARLKDYLATLPPENWNKPSAYDLWQVRDIVAHLAGVAETYTDRINHSLQADPLPEGEATPGPVSAAEFADGNTQRAIARRKRVGDRVFDDFVKENDQLNQLMATLTQQDWEKPHYYSSLGTLPLRFRPDLWISELAMHGWDIRSRFEPHAHLSNESLPVWMDVIPGQLTIFRFTPGPKLPQPLCFRWKLTGNGAKNSDVIVQGDKASMEPAGVSRADVTFQCEIETFLLISLGRLTMDDAVATDGLSITGNSRIAHQFTQWFP